MKQIAYYLTLPWKFFRYRFHGYQKDWENGGCKMCNWRD